MRALLLFLLLVACRPTQKEWTSAEALFWADQFHAALSPRVANAAPPAAQEVCKTSSTGWVNTPFTEQRDSFVVEYDDTPTAAAAQGHTGLAAVAPTSLGQYAVTTRFNSVNRIDAYNGTTYAATTSVPYSPGLRYHFRVLVNVRTHRYTVTVTPPGGAAVALASNFLFRVPTDTVTALAVWSLHNVTTPTHTVCNFTVTPLGAPPPPPPPPPPSGTGTVNLVPFRTTLIATQQQQLYAVVVRADGTVDSFPGLRWESSDSTVAMVDLTGLVTTTPNLGTVTITATDATGRVGRAQLTTTAQAFLSVVRVRWRNVPTPKLFQVPTITPGFAVLPLATGLYQFDLLTGADTTVGHALCAVSP